MEQIFGKENIVKFLVELGNLIDKLNVELKNEI